MSHREDNAEAGPVVAPPLSGRVITTNDLQAFAKRMRSKALWECNAGFYASEAEMAKNNAMQEIYEGIADELDAFFDFDSHLTTEERKARPYG